VGALQVPDRLLSDLLSSLLRQSPHRSLHPTQDILNRQDHQGNCKVQSLAQGRASCFFQRYLT
jgi:hypothetical protein